MFLECGEENVLSREPPYREGELCVKRTPPVPEQEVISAVSSYHLQRFTQRWRLQSPSPLLFSSASPWLMLDQRSQSAEAVIIEAAEGAEPPPPQPRGSINISQIRLQKNTVFIRDLCKLWRRVSPSILCGEPFFLLSAFGVWQKFAYFRLKRVTDLHINRASWLEFAAFRCETEITPTEQKQSFGFIVRDEGFLKEMLHGFLLRLFS